MFLLQVLTFFFFFFVLVSTNCNVSGRWRLSIKAIFKSVVSILPRLQAGWLVLCDTRNTMYNELISLLLITGRTCAPPCCNRSSCLLHVPSTAQTCWCSKSVKSPHYPFGKKVRLLTRVMLTCQPQCVWRKSTGTICETCLIREKEKSPHAVSICSILSCLHPGSVRRSAHQSWAVLKRTCWFLSFSLVPHHKNFAA